MKYFQLNNCDFQTKVMWSVDPQHVSTSGWGQLTFSPEVKLFQAFAPVSPSISETLLWWLSSTKLLFLTQILEFSVFFNSSSFWGFQQGVPGVHSISMILPRDHLSESCDGCWMEVGGTHCCYLAFQLQMVEADTWCWIGNLPESRDLPKIAGNALWCNPATKCFNSDPGKNPPNIKENLPQAPA